MDKQTIISIVSIIIDSIAVIVSVWSCIIAKNANKKSEQALKITESFNSKIIQSGSNSLSNRGKVYGNMIGEQHVNQ